MMKRNEGYTLAYVMVILFVLASVALATMGLALQPAKNQANALKRMQDKYAAQGLAEQVVAQLEHADVATLAEILDAYKDNAQPVYCELLENGNYKLTAKSGKTTVTAEFTLEPTHDKAEPENGGTPEGGNTDETEAPQDPPSATPEPVTIGHTVKYISYKTEVAP